MPQSTLTRRGQTTLPRQVRQALGLQPGDKLRYLIRDDGEVRLLKLRAAASLGGSLPRGEGPPVTLDQIDRAIADGAAEG